jgi:5-methyltetrahydropteroyltriglutamate--homocysteine methyltransferase
MTAIKTTHVGSLPRPQEMMTRVLRKQEITRDDLKRYLTHMVAKQLSLGITFVNNGELPRSDYVSATIDRISGFGGIGTAPLPQDLEDLPNFSRRFSSRNGLITLNPKAPVQLPACSEPLTYVGEASLREELDMLQEAYSRLKDDYPQHEGQVFFTTPSPGTVALFMENGYYPSDEAYLENIAAVMKREYEMIASYGFQLQIDCPDLAMGRHTRYKKLTDEEFLSLIDQHVGVLNAALAVIDPGMCRVHICWGNYPGTHHRDIGLETIFERVMQVKARYISLEASNHRHAHEWRVFEKLPFPEDKILLPGLVDTASTTIEHPALIEERLCRFADLLGPERVIGSTDCGFATTASATSVSGEIAWLKLASLVEGAGRASRRYQ